MFRIVQLDLPFYATLALILLIHYYRKQSITDGVSGKFFLSIIYMLLISNSLSILAILLDGAYSQFAHKASYFLRYFQHLFALAPLIAWYLYYEYKISYSLQSVKKQFLRYCYFITAIILLLLANHFYALFFYIDTNNIYKQTHYYFILYLPLYSSCIYFIMHIVHNFNHIHDDTLKTILYYFLIPFAASVIQLLYQGIAIIWPSIVMITVVAFVKLERSELLTDSLTHLYTRRYIDVEIAHLKHANKPFTLILIDMDKFKYINDTYGHNAGDQALIIMSSILKSNVKFRDTVSRYGGDEFLILLPSSNPFIGEIVASRLTSEIINYNKKKLVPYVLSFSYGTYYVDSDTSETLKSLLKTVDKKMYEHKKSKTL